MSRRLFRTLSAVIATAMVVGACSSSDDTSSSSRKQRNTALPTPWSQVTGTTDEDVTYAVNVDGSGNVVTIDTRNSAALHATSLDSNESDVMRVAARPAVRVSTALQLTKRDSGGTVLWSFEFETTSNVTVAGVKSDSKGNIYVAGTLAGNIDFDPGSGTKYLVDPSASIVNRGFIAKFTAAGAYVSSVYFVADIAYISDIAVDTSGNVVATGVYMGGLTGFATDRKLSLAGTSHFQTFVARFGSSLEIQWLKAVNSSGYSSSRSIAVDSKGNIIVDLSFDGYALWDTPLVLVPTAASTSTSRVMRVASRPRVPIGVVGGYWSAGLIDSLVLKIDSRGAFMWGVQFGGTGHDTPAGIGVDSTGNVYVSGTFGSAGLWVEPDPAGVSPVLNPTDNTVGYLAKITSDGGVKFVKTIGVSDSGVGSFEPGRLVVAADGTTTLSGIIWGKVALNPSNLGSFITSDNNPNAIAASYSADGKFTWVRMFLGGNVQSTDVAVDTTGNVYLTGLFMSNLVIDDALDVAVGTTKGNADGFTVKLSNLGASAKAGSGGAKISVDPTGPTSLPTLGDVTSGVPAPEVSDLKILPDNVPAGVNTTLAQKILTVQVKKTITLKAILASVGVNTVAGSKTSATIAAKSKKNCSATSTKVKGVKVGTCTLTIKVTPKTGKSTKSKVSVVVVK